MLQRAALALGFSAETALKPRGRRHLPGSHPGAGTRPIAGHQRVDGVNALKLVAVDATARTPDTIWVNPATYLPVRWLQTMSFVAAPGGRAWTSRTDYQWLKPTRASLAQLKVRIPVGFTRVPAP